MTTAESTAAIRKALKAAGWTSRDVSVRAESYSMGSAIHILIKNAAVPMALCREIAGKHEHVRRDEATGDILNGGNTYLHVEYSRELMAKMTAPVIAQIPEIAGELREVDGWKVCRENDSEHYYRAWRTGSRQIHCWGREFCARQIVQENLAREHKPRVYVVADCVEVVP